MYKKLVNDHKQLNNHQALMSNNCSQNRGNTRTSSGKPVVIFKKQQGWTFWSLLFVLSVILFVAYVGMQLVPIYSGNENVKNAMENSILDQDLRRINRSTIVKGMKAQMFLDGTSKLIDYKTDLSVTRSRREFTLETSYEREVPLFFNLSLLAKFDNKIVRELSEE